MWCYQMPDFEARLATELQRQQQRRQFCDTLLKTEGVVVPAHSCILSAISPQISSALSSSPAPPAGQSHLLEFRNLDGCTLLRLVRLLYSGEMVGEGERERQEAISAAAELGIHGLVEVPRTQGESPGSCGKQVEVGVQTEPLAPEEPDGRGGLRREARDGCTLLWRDATSGGEGDTWTQNEQAQVKELPPPPPPLSPQPSTSFETIDMASLHSLTQASHSSLLPEQIPHISLSLLYTPEEHQMHQLSSAPMHFLQESPVSQNRSVCVLTPPPTLPPYVSRLLPPTPPPPLPSQEALSDIAAAEQWESLEIEKFQGNIPGYINDFLNSPQTVGSEKTSRRGRPRGRKHAADRGASRAAASTSRTRTPRGGRRSRGKLTQTVDVQDVGVSKLQKLFLQRWGTRLSRTGQGGGAAGRALFLKPREVLKSARSSQRWKAQGKMWTFNPSTGCPPYKEDVPGDKKYARRSRTKKSNQDELPFVQAHGRGSRSETSLPFFTPPAQSRNFRPLSSSDSSLQPLFSPGLTSPASSALHDTPATAAAPPTGQERHIDHLLEEVMMGLNIIPTNNTHSQTLAANVLSGVGSCSTASSETLVYQQQQQQQQQGDGELNQILDHFLMSFEQHNNSTATEEVGPQSSPEAADGAPQQHAVAEPSASDGQPRTTSLAQCAKTTSRRYPLRKRRKKRCRSSWKNNQANVGIPAPSNFEAKRVFPDLNDKQLQQMAVVKLERGGPMPMRVTLPDPSILSTKRPPVSKISSSSVKESSDGSSKKSPHAWLSTKTYPLRNKLKEACLDVDSYLEQSLQLHRIRPRNGRASQARREGPQQEPRLSCGADVSRELQQQQLTESQRDVGGSDEEARKGGGCQTLAEAAGSKRTAEEAEPPEVAPAAKRLCVGVSLQTGSPATPEEEDEDVVDVETVWPSSAGAAAVRGGCGPGDAEEKPVEAEHSGDDLISVGGACSPTADDPSAGGSPSHLGLCAGSPEDAEVDVIGGSSPWPSPVTLTWTNSSEEEEEVNIEEEIAEYSSSAVIHVLD